MNALTWPEGALFPVVENGKKPAVTGWQTWAGELPPGNYGIKTGAASGAWVLDLDTKDGKDGVAALDAYMRERGFALPDTLTVRTPNGGKHLFFTWSAAHPVGNRTGVLPGVDVRSEGGLVVGPGSTINGRPYVVEVDAPIAPAPAWLYELLATRPAAVAGDGKPLRVVSPDDPHWRTLVNEATHYADTTAPAISGQRGHDRLLAFTRHVRQYFGLPRDTARAIVERYSARCSPPWSPTEIEHKLDQTETLYGLETGWQAHAAPGGFFWPLLRPANAPAIPAPVDDAPPGSWRRKQDAAHAYSFASAVEVHGGAPKETRPTEKELAAVFMGASAQPDWRGVFQWDDFRERLVAVDPPMRLDAETRGMSGLDLCEIKLWLACRMGWNVGAERIEQAIRSAANACRFHSVCEYLDALPAVAVDAARAYFDGIAGRLWGAEDDAAESGMFLRQCVAAVRRVRRPGTKVDKMLILHGPQGFKKSLFLARMFGEFFTDELPGDWTNRDAPHALRGKWGVEIAELAAWPKNEEEVKKAFLTRQEDIYREYGTGNEIRRSRQCTFWGSTNADAFLRDATGSRRYDVLHVAKMIDLDAFERDKLWTAASALERAGEPHYLEGDTAGAAEDRRAEHAVTDPWDDGIAKYLRDLRPKGHRYVRAEDALTLAVLRPVEHQTPADLKRVQNILRRLCGESKSCKPGGRGSRNVRTYPVPDAGGEVTEVRARVAAPGELFSGGTIAPLGAPPVRADAPRPFRATA